MGLNYIHEFSHADYLKHVYNATVAAFILGDELFGADMTIPIEDRTDTAIKRVHKLSLVARCLHKPCINRA